MVETPEKIYADRGPVDGWMFREDRMPDTEAEYLRSDIAERQIAELRAKAGKLHDYANMRDVQIVDLVADKARLSEALLAAQKGIAAILENGGTNINSWWDGIVSVQQGIATALSGSSAGGWRMTPRMAEAGKAKLIDLGYTDVEFTDAQKVFEAMMAAAPTATGGR